MENSTVTSGNLLRLMGFMGVCVGIAWALQVLGFDGASTISRLLWVLAAASIAGAGVGFIAASASLPGASAKS